MSLFCYRRTGPQANKVSGMSKDTKENLEELAKSYFLDELKLVPKDIPNAARNLVGYFDVLLRIDERLKKN